ncbi:MAG TPA: sugar phosphate isomerase/epimerase [Gemmatimonadaceae bacterium]|jgi:sugar phosphate isomerase/epimerase
MSTRRDVLKTLSALAAAGLLPRLARADRRLSPSVDSIERIGLQLYTVRTAMAKDMPATLAAVAELGYREVEFAGYFGRSPSEVKSLLQLNGLVAPSTHLGLDDVRGKFESTAESAHTIGIRYLTVASLDMRTLKTVDDWKRMADTFNEVGRHAKTAGLRFGYHNHSVEFAPVDGRLPLAILIEGTDPALVTYELDLYWAVKAGQAPVALFTRHPGRFEMVHVKDATAAPALAMADVGSGTLDWKVIFGAHATAGIKHYFVEHDNPADPMESIRNSAAYLKALRF